MFTKSLSLLPLFRDHVYSGERDTLSGSRHPCLISIRGNLRTEDITLTASFLTWTKLLISMYYTCKNSAQRDKLVLILNLLSTCLNKWLQQITRQKKYFLSWSFINTPQPNLYKGDTYLQYSSQIVETDAASLEFSRKFLRFTPHTFVLTVMCPLAAQCWATRILKHWDRCNAQINIGEGKTYTSVSRFLTRIGGYTCLGTKGISWIKVFRGFHVLLL